MSVNTNDPAVVPSVADGGSFNVLSRLRRVTFLEWLIVAATVGIVTALLLPATKWASSGSVNVPVRVVVFDAARSRPIGHARVLLFRAPPYGVVAEPENDGKDTNPFHPYGPAGDRFGLVEGVTGTDGVAVIQYTIGTGTNHNRPVTRAHVDWMWVEVQAEGYGGVIVPVRHVSVPAADIRKSGELVVPSTADFFPEQDGRFHAQWRGLADIEDAVV
jgi:hypothetical protein